MKFRKFWKKSEIFGFFREKNFFGQKKFFFEFFVPDEYFGVFGGNIRLENSQIQLFSTKKDFRMKTRLVWNRYLFGLIFDKHAKWGGDTSACEPENYRKCTDGSNCKYAKKRQLEKLLFEGNVEKNIRIPTGPPINLPIQKLERKMRSVKYKNGIHITKFVSYTKYYGCDDEESISIMSVFFVYDQGAKMVFHTLYRREIEITETTKRTFIEIMKNQ